MHGAYILGVLGAHGHFRNSPGGGGVHVKRGGAQVVTVSFLFLLCNRKDNNDAHKYVV